MCSNLSKYLLIELAMIIPHPSPLLQDVYYQQKNLTQNTSVYYPLNDIFAFIIYISTIFHLLEFFTASRYNSSRI